jgi:hypothetical protein
MNTFWTTNLVFLVLIVEIARHHVAGSTVDLVLKDLLEAERYARKKVKRTK